MKKIVVVRGERRLTEDQIGEAFGGNVGALWYRALVQVIEEEMENSVMASAAAAEQNNPLRMATELGGYAALNGLLAELNRRVQSSSFQ
jgi:hypothetical protein